MPNRRKSYPSDVSDDEWSLVVPYLTLMREDAAQRKHSLRELFNGLRYLVRYGIAWRAMPNDLPPWFSVYQQAQRWLSAGCFENLAHDLRAVLRLAESQGVKLEERPFSVAEALVAREAFMSAASAFVLPIIEIDGHKIGDGRPGPVARAFRALYIDEARKG